MLQVHYGSGEGGAFTSPYSGTAEFSVWVSVRANEDVAFRPLATSPSFDVRPGTVSTLEVIAPSSVAANSSFDIRVVARDTLGNRCRDWSGWFAVHTDAQGVRIRCD